MILSLNNVTIRHLYSVSMPVRGRDVAGAPPVHFQNVAIASPVQPQHVASTPLKQQTIHVHSAYGLHCDVTKFRMETDMMLSHSFISAP